MAIVGIVFVLDSASQGGGPPRFSRLTWRRCHARVEPGQTANNRRWFDRTLLISWLGSAALMAAARWLRCWRASLCYARDDVRETKFKQRIQQYGIGGSGSQDESRRVVKGWVLDRLSQEGLEWAVGTAETSTGRQMPVQRLLASILSRPACGRRYMLEERITSTTRNFDRTPYCRHR